VAAQSPGRLRYDAGRQTVDVIPIGAATSASQLAITAGADRYTLMISTTP